MHIQKTEVLELNTAENWLNTATHAEDHLINSLEPIPKTLN